MLEIDYLFDELVDMITVAKKSMFSANEVIVNRSKMLETIAQIRASLPEVIKESQYIRQEAERIKGEALSSAQKTVQQAEQRAAILLDEHELLAAATAEADQIRADAVKFRETVELNTMVKLDAMLHDSEVALFDAISLVRGKREELRDSGAGAPDGGNA